MDSRIKLLQIDALREEVQDLFPVEEMHLLKELLVRNLIDSFLLVIEFESK